jgi:hypothetical protein
MGKWKPDIFSPMVPPVASLNARDRRTIRKTLGLWARRGRTAFIVENT